MKIYAAPIQGFTEAPWRKAHQRIFGGVEAYFTPFVRIERGDFRSRDLRDIAPENQGETHVVPQLLAATPDELNRIVECFHLLGYREADINMGCPHPPVVGKKRGSGLLPHPDRVETLLSTLEQWPEMQFSVKMRHGLDEPSHWEALMQLLNSAPLKRITLHPRLGRQQYRGEVDIEVFAKFYEACQHPLVYNGDILSLNDISSIEAQFPKLEGIMIGRGLLARPTLAAEYANGKEFSAEQLRELSLQLHQVLFEHYSANLQGDTQILNKIKPFWEYLLPDADKRVHKAIKKATNIRKYLDAVNSL